MAKEFLSRKGIPFVGVDVVNDPLGREQLLKLGIRNVPALAQGSRCILAQDLEAVAKFVGLDGTGRERLSPPEILEKWINVLRATQRYVRQIPMSRMTERMTAERDRSVRVMGYHIFRVVEVYLAVIEDGAVYSSADTELPPTEQKSDASGDEIAVYGGTVIARLQRWWDGFEDKSFEQPVPTEYGMRSLQEILERSAWHSAQHARQLIAVMERFGVEPDGRLTAKDLQGLPLPESVWG